LPTLILSALLLPPGSLAERLLTIGYESIDSAGGAIQTADGMQLTFMPAPARDRVKVKVEAVSRKAFLEGTAGDRLGPAAGSLPPDLTLISPVYHIQAWGQPPSLPVILKMPVSKGMASTRTLDLYTWNGQTWEWLPGRQLRTSTMIEAELDSLPETVAVMQTNPLKPRVSADLSAQAGLPAEAMAALVEINPPGLMVEANGQISGTPGDLVAESGAVDLAVVPVLRNRAEGNPLDRLLADAEARQRHVAAIVELVQSHDYQGIDLDYRGIKPELRREYTTFLTELRAALPAEKQLSVRLELPQRLSTGTWDSGAYDWPALGRIADVVKLATLPDPKAYAAGGQMEALLDWAVSQIKRHKLQLLVRTGSVEWLDGQTREISDQEALERLGAVMPLTPPEEVIEPGQKIEVTLGGQAASTGIQVDVPSGTYWFAYLDEDNRHHTVYLKNVSGLSGILKLVTEYRLAGIAIQDSPGHSNDAEFWAIVHDFLNQTGPAVESRYTVAWRVRGNDGQVIGEATKDLGKPNYVWTAPAAGGAFEVAASISSRQDGAVLPRGTVVFMVATPTPTPSPTLTPTATPSPTLTPTRTPTPAPTPVPPPVQSGAVQQPKPAAPPPAVAPVNVPFGYGIQADPRGDTAASIGYIKALGFNWVKFQMAWKDVEPAPGDYSWGMWDNIINAYHSNGIQVLLSIPKAPDWARPFDDDKSVEGPPQDPGQYAGFVAMVADRYRGQVQAIEIWNEQNLWYEAGGVGRIDAANYVQLLQMSYRAVKEANPQLIVVSGALTPAGNVGGVAVDDIDYLNQMYAGGVKGFFDALGAHPSGYNCPANGDWRTVQDPTATGFRGPFDNRHHSWCFRGTMEGYREVMAANGDAGKAIVPTEFGWAVSGNPQPGYEYARDNTLEEQAQWIVEAYQLGKNWGWAGPMFLWNLDYGVTAPGTELANFGILNRPAYEALANMPK
ncbi:MAG: glycosyl hydrolase family 18 protein, partial [Chloroflexota bacterium]